MDKLRREEQPEDNGFLRGFVLRYDIERVRKTEGALKSAEK